MKRINLILAVLAMIFGLSAISYAQTGTRHYRRNINKRQENQQDRIAQGIKSGNLTPREAARLERRETRLIRTEARYRRSGNGLSQSERARLERRLNNDSRRIYRRKHDT